MGTYFNPRNKKFHDCVNDDIFVDKTGLIAYTNSCISRFDKYICVSRPRRFGKSVTADMLTAYYSRGCDSHTLFEGLDIAKGPSFEEHLNKYNVVYFDVAQLIKTDVDAKCGIEKLTKNLFKELRKEYPDIDFGDQDDLISVFSEIYDETDIGFIFIIDEWDSPFRERKNDKDSQELYLQFLKDMFKNREYISLVYITGILPIKKYLTGSALNMFCEYTMLDPGPVKEYIGFTAEEVKNLAEGTEIPFDDLKYWYDGYNLGGVEIYNSNSVYKALANKDVHGYWEKTESFEDLLGYIKEDRFGIHRVILDLLSDIKRTVNFSGYMNDLVTINNLDDILAILVHLGYLAFEKKPAKKGDDESGKALLDDLLTDENILEFMVKSDGTVRIPNHEIREEFLTVLENLGSFESNEFELISAKIVSLTFNGSSAEDMDALAERIERVHDEYVSDYHNYDTEDSLSNTVRLAYFNLINDYYSRTEASSLRGRADVIFTPRKGKTLLPMVMEFKVDDTAENALFQIKDKRYYKAFYEYKGDVLLLGIVYDSKTKKHVVKKEIMAVDNTKLL